MAASVDDVVHPSHDMQVASFVLDSRVSSSVVTWGFSKIFLDKSLVVSPES